MADITAIGAGLSAVKTAMEIVASLRSLDRQLKTSEFKLKLAELTELLADVKTKLVEAREENADLRRELQSLRQKRNLRAAIRLDDNVYVPTEGRIEGYGEGPWCTNCFDTTGVLVALHHKVAASINDVAWYKWECPSCKSAVAAPRRDDRARRP